MKKQLYIFSEIDRDPRIKRISEESRKREIDVSVVNINRCIITQNEILYENTDILTQLIQNSTCCWILGNSAIGHHIGQIVAAKGIFIWPSPSAINFSDKFYTSCFFAHINIPTPKTAFINSHAAIPRLISEVGGFPCIIKKNNGSKGQFVECAHTESDIHQFITKTLQPKENSILKRSTYLLQEFLEESAGCDYRVLCLADEVIGIIHRKSASGFKANISLGGTATRVEKNVPLETMAQKIMKKSGLFYAGIDFLTCKDGYAAIEINTSAQFAGFEHATQINTAQKIVDALMRKMGW